MQDTGFLLNYGTIWIIKESIDKGYGNRQKHKGIWYITVEKGGKSCLKITQRVIYTIFWKVYVAECLFHLLKTEDRPRCSKASPVHTKVFPCHEDKCKHMRESVAAHLFSGNCDGSVEGCCITCIEDACIVFFITFFVQRFKDMSHTVFAGVDIVPVVNVRKNVFPLSCIATNVLKHRKARPGEFTDKIGEDADIMLSSGWIFP